MTTTSNLKISVIIPTHNRSLELCRALTSLQKQTFKSFDIIVVDDNSTENLQNVVDAFPDLKISLVKNYGRGANAARNTGTDLAKGKYIAYLDSDDIFHPNKLMVLSKQIELTASDVIISKLFVWRDDSSNTIRPGRFPEPNEDISEYYFVCDQRMQTSSICVQTKLAQRVRWNENLPKVQDPDFTIRIHQAAQNPIYIDDVLATLYDIPNDQRISGKSFYVEIVNWLNSSTCPLSNAAKKSFLATIVPVEQAKQSKLKALKTATKHIQINNLKLYIKTVLQIVLKSSSFKKIGQIVRPKASAASRHDILDYIQKVEKDSTFIFKKIEHDTAAYR